MAISDLLTPGMWQAGPGPDKPQEEGDFWSQYIVLPPIKSYIAPHHTTPPTPHRHQHHTTLRCTAPHATHYAPHITAQHHHAPHCTLHTTLHRTPVTAPHDHGLGHTATPPVDHSHSRRGGLILLPGEMPNTQVPGAPQPRAPLHGPPHGGGLALKAGPSAPHPLVGAFWGKCNTSPLPGPTAAPYYLNARMEPGI